MHHWMAAAACAAMLGAGSARADAPPKLDAKLAKDAGAGLERTVAYYRSIQSPGGSFAAGDKFDLGITGLAVAGLARSKRLPAADPLLAKSIAYIKGHVQPDGGIYIKGEGQQNYFTGISIMALAAANRNGEHAKLLADGAKFLKANQFAEDHPGALKVDRNDPKHGGFGYGKTGRPDLSNTSVALEALVAAGVSGDDPALQRARLFIARCQNFKGEGGNDLLKDAAAADVDGGFVYAPLETRVPAPNAKTPAGGLRSYASMTYAGLKSFLHAGVSADDPRAKAALAWIGQHYSVDENPGLGKSGLYYYYHTFAKALALAEPALQDAAGQPRNWRADLCRKLLAEQKPDGSWANTDDRWLETNPKLATGFAFLALLEATK